MTPPVPAIDPAHYRTAGCHPIGARSPAGSDTIRRRYRVRITLRPRSSVSERARVGGALADQGRTGRVRPPAAEREQRVAVGCVELAEQRRRWPGCGHGRTTLDRAAAARRFSATSAAPTSAAVPAATAVVAPAVVTTAARTAATSSAPTCSD